MEKMPVSHVLEFNLFLKMLNDFASIMHNIIGGSDDLLGGVTSQATSRSHRTDSITDLSDIDPNYQSVFNKATGCLVINDQTDKRCLAGALIILNYARNYFLVLDFIINIWKTKISFNAIVFKNKYFCLSLAIYVNKFVRHCIA